MQRALLARALVSRPEILLLDEPSSYVDQEFEERMYEIFREINKTTTVILVSHELNRMEEMATRIVRINRSIREITGNYDFRYNPPGYGRTRPLNSSSRRVANT